MSRNPAATTAVVASLMFGVAGLAVGLGVAMIARKEHPKEILRNVMSRMNIPIPDELKDHGEDDPGNSQTEEERKKFEEEQIRERINKLLVTDTDEVRERIERSGRVPFPQTSFTVTVTPSNANRLMTTNKLILQANTITTDSFPFSTETCWNIFTFLNIPELTTLLSVSNSWSAFASIVRNDRGYQRACARLGFPDGITGRLRGKCWQVVCGADKVMQPIANARRAYGELLAQIKNDPHFSINSDMIAKDVTRTLNMLPAFTQRKDAINALSNVLNAYAVIDSEVGYTQGMNFVAGYLLTRMTEVEAFWTFHTLMCTPYYHWRQFYVPTLRGLLLCKYQFRELFRAHMPELFAHFEAIGVPSDVISEWFMTFFSVRKFPEGTLDCVWDWLLVDGIRAMHRVALAILHLSAPFLMTTEMEDAVFYIKVLPDDGILQPRVLLPTALAFLVPQRWLDAMERQFDQEFPEVPSSS